MGDQTESRKIPITLSDEQWKEIEKFRNVLGETRAEMVRAIVVDWLLDKTSEQNLSR